MTIDGGPEENPCYEKVIGFAIQHFKRHDLDALLLATNSPGKSAYNSGGTEWLLLVGNCWLV